MRISRIFQGDVSTAAKTLSDKIGGVSGNGILISVAVGGSGHAEADFDAHIINLTLKQKLAESISLIQGITMLDALKISDFRGGFSADLEGDDGARYVAYLALDRVILEGDDMLECSIACPGDASATYKYTVSLIDAASKGESLMGYERITGNGAEQVILNVDTLYLVSNPTGATITVKDHEGAESFVDYDVADLGNALGQMESYEEIGIIYADKYKVSQNIRVKLPGSSYAVAQRRFFQLSREHARSSSEDTNAQTVFAKIAAEDPEKFEVLKLRKARGEL